MAPAFFHQERQHYCHNHKYFSNKMWQLLKQTERHCPQTAGPAALSSSQSPPGPFRFPSPCCHTSTWTQRCLQQLRPPHCPAALFSGELQRRDGVPQMGRNEKGVSSRDSGRLITPKGRQTVSLEQRKGRDKYTPSKKTLLFFKICLI